MIPKTKGLVICKSSVEEGTSGWFSKGLNNHFAKEKGRGLPSKTPEHIGLPKEKDIQLLLSNPFARSATFNHVLGW